jgi:general secretion pathway protein J
MLVALLIFAMIAGGALALLRFSVDAELASRAGTDRVAASRRFLSVWTADLAQITPRLARDESGAVHAALEAGGAGGMVLRFTRSGWSNADGAARPACRRWNTAGTARRWCAPAIRSPMAPRPSRAPPSCRWRAAGLALPQP